MSMMRRDDFMAPRPPRPRPPSAPTPRSPQLPIDLNRIPQFPMPDRGGPRPSPMPRSPQLPIDLTPERPRREAPNRAPSIFDLIESLQGLEPPRDLRSSLRERRSIANMIFNQDGTLREGISEGNAFRLRALINAMGGMPMQNMDPNF